MNKSPRHIIKPIILNDLIFTQLLDINFDNKNVYENIKKNIDKCYVFNILLHTIKVLDDKLKFNSKLIYINSLLTILENILYFLQYDKNEESKKIYKIAYQSVYEFYNCIIKNHCGNLIPFNDIIDKEGYFINIDKIYITNCFHYLFYEEMKDELEIANRDYITCLTCNNRLFKNNYVKICNYKIKSYDNIKSDNIINENHNKIIRFIMNYIEMQELRHKMKIY
jgi:hypothetical protein